MKSPKLLLAAVVIGGGSFLAVPLVATIAQQQSCAPTAPGTVLNRPDIGGLDSYLAATRIHESAGNYGARSTVSDASGAYQFLFSTWRSAANAAGQAQWANTPAYAAPPAVQDAVAAFKAAGAYNGPANHDWLLVSDIWFIGHPASAGELDVSPPGNGGLTPRKYRQQIADLMNAQDATLTPTPAPTPVAVCPVLTADGSGAVELAKLWLGTPYQWGGGHGGKIPVGTPVDCSGLVDQIFGITGNTYTQIGMGIAVATLDAALPGDLVFFGSLAVSEPFHVGIYVGAGKMIDAPHTGSVVRYDDVASFGTVDGIRRLVQPPAPPPVSTTTIAPTVSTGV